MSGYYEFTVEVGAAARDAVLNHLLDNGATGFVERDSGLTAYFKETVDPVEVGRSLDEFRNVLRREGLDPHFLFSHSHIGDRDWNETWKEGIKAMDVGRGLTIVPPWLQAPSGRISLIIDSGRAFGTGHHETTRLCLKLIEDIAAAGALSLLDVGTGSGILAVGAALLGIKTVTAVDNDPDAVEAVRINLDINKVDNVEILEGTISNVEGTYDAVVANLISDTLVAIAGELAARLNPGGTALLSGMIEGQEKGVLKAAEDAGLSLLEVIHEGKWVTLIVSKDSKQ
ncbi:MAG: 50S ribosomal protein L11 methyltransferase [Nitrospira sp.]|nr:50S ribosomal protein L11 methyltransferase [Nitrospira sp.]